MRLSRRPELPPDARETLPLHRRERVLTAARLVDGTWVAATQDALVLPGRRLEWASVAHAEWADDGATLIVDMVDPAEGESGTSRLVLDEPGRLPEVVRERVTASTVASRHVAVRGRAGVRVVARRAPGSDELVWQVVTDRGLDPADPDVRAASVAAIAELSRELGL
jgi:hypothetical protein